MTWISDIIVWLSDIFEDLMGCKEGDSDCEDTADKYASWVVYGTIAVIILVVAVNIMRWFKSD